MRAVLNYFLLRCIIGLCLSCIEYELQLLFAEVARVNREGIAMNISWKQFSGTLRAIRERNNLSQEEFGKHLHCSQNYIWRLEHGQRKPSSIFIQLLRAKFLLDHEKTGLCDGLEVMRRYHIKEDMDLDDAALALARLSF